MSQKIKIKIQKFVRREVGHLQSKMNSCLKRDYRAMKEAKKVIGKRLKGMNEFREQLREQTGTFLTRAEYDLAHRFLTQRTDGLAKIVYIGVGICLVAQLVLGAFIIHLLKK